MYLQKLAEKISVILGPQVWLPLIIVIFTTRTGINTTQITILLPITFLFQVALPALYIYVALKLKKISAWDLPKREERYLFLVVTFVSYLISLIFVYALGNTLLFNLNLILFILLIIISLITRFWKISHHAAVNMAGSILINFLLGWTLPLLYLVIPVVIWARFRLKRHTLMQLIFGTIVSAVVTLMGLFYFRYL